MKVAESIGKLLRGPRASRLLERLGVDPKRYWLLVDLFAQLSERGEMLDQLGANEIALKTVTWLYGVMFALLSVLFVVARMDPATYLSIFLAFTMFLLLFVLLSETGNSLVNPVEGLVVAHQPINGATYTAAKLTHLVRIVLYLVAAMNAVPAFAALALVDTPWFYPVAHLLAALTLGSIAALLCCALYGWLIRLIPAKRLKAAGQLAATLPFLGMLAWESARDLLVRLRVLEWLPAPSWARWALAAGLAAAFTVIVVIGIRSLSVDYLIRVSSIVHGGSAPRAGRRRSWTGDIVARHFGGQPGRAGFIFVSRLMRRDFQFRRQAVAMLILMLFWFGRLLVGGWRSDPFGQSFSTVHLTPHLIGVALFFVCGHLPYGNDYQGAWTFQLAPAQAFGRFAQGIHAALWIPVVCVPHLAMLALFSFAWGPWRAGLFAAYSMAISSLYLAAELRLIDSVPFSQQVDPKRSATLLPLMMAGGIVMALAVGLQYFFVFRSVAVVVSVTIGAAVAAYLLTPRSLGAMETAMRYSLASLPQASGRLYTEVNV